MQRRIRFLAAALCCALLGLGAGEPRAKIDLRGIWEILPDPELQGVAQEWWRPAHAGPWKLVAVPAAWETALGVAFDTVAWYRTRVQVPASAAGARVLLTFRGAATDARVWVEGKELGSHLGAWTPFTFDATAAVTPGALATIVVRLDEKVGHNTQGFLPIVAPHFGGLWQGVELSIGPEARLDGARVRIDASRVDTRARRAALAVALPVDGAAGASQRVAFQLRGPHGELAGKGIVPVTTTDNAAAAAWQWEGPAALWHIGEPNLYTLAATLLDATDAALDTFSTRVGFRHVRADADRVLLNDLPIVVRGVLNWGVYPPLLAPAPEPARFRAQVRYLRACGFNLVKFCLWLPPEELLDIVDDEGMLAWIEYPTWHPIIDRAHRDELLSEYTQMVALDRAHACAVIRSITCETGPSADLEVLREIYNLLKAACPGTLVEDDSSWVGWNRIHDFWDDHPYGNNRTWRATLKSLGDHIAARTVKPLLLGEAIAADTWTDTKAMFDLSVDARPWWTPNWFDALLVFERDLQQRYARAGFDPCADIRASARKYAMDMRRFQVETYREVMPNAGYVISVIRDTRLCAMGLFDDLDRPKWTPEDWSWHGQIAAPLVAPGDQRAFDSSLALRTCARVAPDGSTREPCLLVWRFPDGNEFACDWKPGDGPHGPADAPALRMPPVARPTRTEAVCRVVANGQERILGAWELWALPAARPVPAGLVLYGNDAGKGLAALFPGATALAAGAPIPPQTPAVVTCTVSPQVLDYLEDGGRVFHIASLLAGSFREEPLWFLRGTAWAPPEPAAFFEHVPREMLMYLQLFELGGGTVIRGERLWNEVDVLLGFPETHDLKTVRPDLLLFTTGVGRGRLAVSCLRHEGPDNFAGLWLAREIVAYLRDGPSPVRSLTPPVVDAIRSGLDAQIVRVRGAWRFAKDEADEGMAKKFFASDLDDGAWLALTPRSAAEKKLWDEYNGWGWYRTRVAVPAAWKGRRIAIVFDSVDDMYELFVNGRPAGGRGKADRSETSFEKKTWLDVTQYLEPGRENLLALRILDWGGGGGIAGDVCLTTGPIEEGLDLIAR